MPTTADSVAVADTLGTVDMPAVGQGAMVRQNAGAAGGLSALGPLGRLSPRLLLMIGGAALVAVIAAAMLWSRAPDYRVLYSNVSDNDGGAIIAALQQMNVPYRFADGGTAIMVPEANVHEARLKLATQGLPKGGQAGFELMENQKFGTSQFAEQVNYQRALEGELARTIQAMQEVQSARVHLAMTKPSVFVREQAKPSASVLLKLYPGRMLDRSQVQAIGHLVSSSVPNLPLANVTVVDQSGRLLSSAFQDNASGLDPTQLNYVRDVEQGYIKRIEAILGPVVGEDNVRAQVTADVDLDNTEQMAETYRPNQDPSTAAVRSTHTAEATQNKADAQGGVPGALSNQPPTAPRMLPTAPAPASASQPAATGPNGQPQQPVAAANTSGTATSGNASSTRDSTTNYEVDKTVRRTRAAVGTVRRLSVAVVVNYRGDGKTWKPLSQAEMTQLNALVKDAVGYDVKRGDSVNVVNSQFSGTLPIAKDDLPLWKQPDMIQYAIQAAKYGALAIGFLILVFAVIRPLIRSLGKKAEPVTPTFVGREGEDPNAPIITGAAAAAGPGLEGPAAAVAGAESEELPDALPQLKNNDFEKKLETMRRVAQSNPRAVAAVIKQWVSNE